MRANSSIVWAAVAGLLQAWSTALPLSGQTSGSLQVLAMLLLVHLLQAANSPRQAAWRVWVFATTWFTATFWWLFTALHTFGGLPALLAIVAVVGLAGALSLYHAAAGALYMRLKPGSPIGQALLWGALWMLAELARSVWFTGFGWGGVAYAHVDSLMAAWAPWVGAHGMAAVLAIMAMALYQLWRQVSSLGFVKATFQSAVLPLCLLIPAVWQGLMPEGWSRSHGKAEVTLLQGNIAQDEKFQAGSGVPDALQWYGQALLQAQSPLTIAPETAIPLLPDQLPPGYWDQLQARFATGQQAALLGMPMGNFSQGYTNAVIGLKPQSPPWQYDKHHLVPFGEFIPPWFRWFTDLMNIPLGSFNRGGLNQPSFAWAGQTWGVNICFEDLFGEELAQRFLAQEAPSIFVNVSNIAWFGRSQAPDQHLAISRLRALEFERPFVRATNTGMTAAIDHRGQVTALLPRFERGSLDAVVEGRSGTTPYVWWVARFGLWPLWVVGGLVLLACWLIRRREAP